MFGSLANSANRVYGTISTSSGPLSGHLFNCPEILIMAPSVAIAGAAGHLGQYITAAFLSPPFQNAFSRIILLSRQEQGASSPLAQYKSHEKVVFRQYDENNPSSALDGAQILVNTIGASGHDFKEKLLRALPGSSVHSPAPTYDCISHPSSGLTITSTTSRTANGTARRNMMPWRGRSSPL